MATCSFCNQDCKLTREHLFSSSILRIFEPQAAVTFTRNNAYKGDPVIKDLCADCNSALSPYDNAMRVFAEENLTSYKKPPWDLKSKQLEIRLWVLKTAMNIERADRRHSWWKKYIPNVLNGNVNPDLDIFFAPWCDLSPGAVVTSMNIVKSLDSKTSMIVGSSGGTWQEIEKCIHTAWTIKVGFGVFLMLDWIGSSALKMRATVVADLVNWGWSLLGYNDTTRGVPFNRETCAVLGMIADPRRPVKVVLKEDGCSL